MTTTISESGAHAAAAATDRIPALKSPFDATGKGYTTPLQILGGLAYVDVASATTTDIGAVASDKVRITGTTTITGLGTVASGTRRSVRFAAALTLTHNATSLILPGAANITTAANDTAEFDSLGSGNWICTSYKRADGMAPLTGTGWATILATTPPYIPIYPTGVAATDTAAVAAALTEANSTKKPIEVQRNGNILRINAGQSVLSDTRWIGNGVTHEIQVGSGGFNSTVRADKFNQNGQNTCVFMVGNAGGTAERENVSFHDVVFTASAATERVLALIVATDGFDDSQFRVSDILIKDIYCHAGGGYIAVNSLGDGSALIENIRAQDCGITGTTWTGTPQLTIVEIDTDIPDGPSKPGVIRGIRGKQLSFSGSALSTYGDESDLVTLGGAILTGKSGAWQVSDLYGTNLGEVLDCFANGAQITNVRGENISKFVIKLTHGARYCTINNVSGRTIGLSGSATAGALITIQGSGTASSGDTMNNVISNCTVEDFDVNESVGVLFAENTGTVGLPKRNTIYGLRMLGDSNGDHYVKDNCTTDADNDNRVYLIDGSAAGTKTTSIVHADNTKVHAINRAHTQISLGANQTVSTLATLDFSVATVDPEGIAVTASDKVTVKWPGLYLVEIGLRFSTDLDDQDTVEIRVVGGGVTQVTRTTIGKGGEEDIVRASFHVLVKEQDIGGASADIYAQAAVEGASNATVLATTNYTGMWLTRIG